MTPVRNEAWVLQATSLWADYIIIADQQSTDGSKEIALSYPKVILIDNKNPDFNESERQKLLIDKAREIEGDKILFGLDADEIFSANFTETNDWKLILNSKPGDVFWFKWAEICPDQKTYWKSNTVYYPWMFHDDGIEPHGNYVRNMHSMRIPYPIDEKQMYYVNDFDVLHLAYLNQARVDAKRRFYKFVDWEMNHRSAISLSRSYAQVKKEDPIYELPLNYIYAEPSFTFNLFDVIDTNSVKFWFDDYIYDRIEKNRLTNIKKLDIWDNQFLRAFNLNDPRPIWIKIIHKYLQTTQKISKNLFIRIVDKIMKRLF
jgi:hypothetical protein